MWLKIGERRINTANIAVYGIDEGSGDSYIVWAAGHKTAYVQAGVAMALDLALRLNSEVVNKLPVKANGDTAILPANVQMKARSRNGGHQ